MDQALCRFGQIQLQMTAKPRVIVDDGQCHGTVPCSLFVENADFGQVKIKVPEAMDMGKLRNREPHDFGAALPLSTVHRSVVPEHLFSANRFSRMQRSTVL